MSRVLIAHPGAAHFIYELVVAAVGLGHDTRFATGFYHDPKGGLARLVARLPSGLAAKLERELKRRSFPGLDPAIVDTDALLELAYVGSARIFRSRPALPERVMHWRNSTFDARIAARIRAAASAPEIVIGHDTSCLETLRAARERGALAVLNQMIGHLAIGDAILREEAERQPLWADSMHAGAPAWLIDQCRQEALTADRILSPSPYVSETLRQVGVPEERIRLQPFGVRVDRFRPAERPRGDGKIRLLYVGQISQRKGLAYLLEAMARLQRSDLELVLVGGIVGAGRGLEAYRPWFRHIPNVPHHEVADLFRSADLFVYPSLHEGSALALIEAMASGLPVITTLNSGTLARDGEDGVLVPIRAVDPLAEAITRLADDPTTRAAMAASARARALEFTWDHYRTRLVETLAR
ncbi:MAG: glycosyltransferase [Alphaproteobacteria bacterium]|nr:MAG: glycosyltransferase [Alphaproteobacteria bacterium]